MGISKKIKNKTKQKYVNFFFNVKWVKKITPKRLIHSHKFTAKKNYPKHTQKILFFWQKKLTQTSLSMKRMVYLIEIKSRGDHGLNLVQFLKGPQIKLFLMVQKIF